MLHLIWPPCQNPFQKYFRIFISWNVRLWVYWMFGIYMYVYTFFSNVRFGSKIHCALMNRIFQRKYSDNYTMCLADLLNPVRYKQVLFKSEMDTSAADRTGQLEKDEADCLYIHRQDKRTGRREGEALIGCSSQCLCVLVCPLCLWAVSWSCSSPPTPPPRLARRFVGVHLA